MFVNFSLIVRCCNPVLEDFTTGCTGASVFHLDMTWVLCLAVVNNIKGVEGVVYCTE